MDILYYSIMLINTDSGNHGTHYTEIQSMHGKYTSQCHNYTAVKSLHF